MHKPIFVSGPHGGGKSALIQRLIQRDNRLTENDLTIDVAEEFQHLKLLSSFEKTLLRMLIRVVRVQRAYEMASNEPDRIILTDRSVYDSLAYAHVYRELEWVTSEEYMKLHAVKEKVPLHARTIILNPPVETLLERLENRKKNKERVVRDALFNDEDTVEFVTLLQESFTAFEDDPNVIVVRNNEKDEIEKILQWIHHAPVLLRS
ncbi:MAG: AAA family ATPase [archaeon]